MHTFSDSRGHLWEVAVNVLAVKRVRESVGIDLTAVINIGTDGKPDVSVLEQLAGDPVLLVDTLFVLCQDQARREGVTDEEFGRGMLGDAVAEATTALLAEIVNFFPRPKRLILSRILEQAETLREKAEKAIVETVQSPEFSQKIRADLSMLFGSPTSSAESSE